MSVLNQSGEEQVECPLCMEPLEVDDLNFFPCTCGYQICRFCWHRIRTDENGLCPACRKAYPEDPADFKPLTQEEVAKLKAEKRQKDQQRKQKISENRKHLANVRVVQKNLVFVVGLPMRLADPEVLKKHEYFGKFGKIHKVVINQSTSYAGSQGPSASAYVTYQKSDDALRAIQSVNNIIVDGRTVKTSLGTTKYCSHFMKNQPCPKQDCMYLHELGDADASFTKEEMQQGKHQEYEKKLHEQLLSNTLNRKPSSSPPTVASTAPPGQQAPVCKEAWPSLHPNHSQVIVGVVAPSSSPPEGGGHLINNGQFKNDNKKQNNMNKVKSRNCSDEIRRSKDSGSSSSSHHSQETLSGSSPEPVSNHMNLIERHHPIHQSNHLHHNHHNHNHHHHRNSESGADDNKSDDFPEERKISNSSSSTSSISSSGSSSSGGCVGGVVQVGVRELQELAPGGCGGGGGLTNGETGMGVYCHGTGSIGQELSGRSRQPAPNTVTNWHVNGVKQPATTEVTPQIHLTSTLSEKWQINYGRSREKDSEEEQLSSCLRDDDLGFDPFHETQKALEEMIEKEKQRKYQPNKILMHHNNRLNNCSKLLEGLRIGTTVPHPRAAPPPPGFTSTPSHMNAFGLGIPRTGSKLLPFIHPSVAFPTSTPPPTGWDWTALDPAIVTASAPQHCELYPTNPPPGFSLRQTLDNL